MNFFMFRCLGVFLFERCKGWVRLQAGRDFNQTLTASFLCLHSSIIAVATLVPL